MFFCISIIFIGCKVTRKKIFFAATYLVRKSEALFSLRGRQQKITKTSLKVLFNSIGTTTLYTNIKTVRMRRSQRFRLMNYNYDVSGGQSFFLSYLTHTKLQRFKTRALQIRHAGSFNTPRAGYVISSILRGYPVIDLTFRISGTRNER